MTFTARIRIRGSYLDKEGLKIGINKVRLYYLFSNQRQGLLKYLETDVVRFNPYILEYYCEVAFWKRWILRTRQSKLFNQRLQK